MDFLQIGFLLHLKYFTIFVREDNVKAIDGFHDQPFLWIFVVINNRQIGL